MKTLLLAASLVVTIPYPAFSGQKVTDSAKVHPHRSFVLAALAKHNAAHGEVKTDSDPVGDALPNCFEDRFYFPINSIAPAGGQIFICSRRKYGDAIRAHFKAHAALAGPYIYQSKDGKVVVQLNRGLKAVEAEKFEASMTDLELPADE